jgi:hypothetical protein
MAHSLSADKLYVTNWKSPLEDSEGRGQCHTSSAVPLEANGTQCCLRSKPSPSSRPLGCRLTSRPEGEQIGGIAFGKDIGQFDRQGESVPATF